ncbi:MAG: gliding motility-associated ABC transporter substrate-binding protein GldG [Cyclobacteriaceae bacterium]|nr:gliding motility-associated ABC transporter substrate-binding protein GldG [Cyclobacteriaceae bacterium]
MVANALALAWVVNLASQYYFFRLDLTEEKRYSIKAPTQDLLESLDDDVFIEVFLAGDLNAGFKRLQKAIEETLTEFRITSNNKVHFAFTDPATAMGEKAQREFMNELVSKGVNPTNVIDTKSGQRVEKLVFPGVVVSYGGFEKGVTLLKGNRALTSDQILNQSIEGLEYELANAISQLTTLDRKRVGLVLGHGELDSLEIASFNNALLDQYDVFKVDITRKQDIGDYDLIVVSKPTKAFSEVDKLKLDQYVMGGGKLLLLLDRMDAIMDSASREDYLAFPYQLNLDDLLFKYGVRINPDLVQDLLSARYPIVTGQVGGKPQMTQLEWPFFPLINQYTDHPVGRNLDAAILRFVSSIDTVKAVGVKKTPLMFTSPASRKLGAPVQVSVNDLRQQLDPVRFQSGPIPVAYLLEGHFTSLYKDRFLPEGLDSIQFVDQSVDTKIIVVADGDIVRNDINPRTRQPQQLGFDAVSSYTFANQDLLLNMVSFLVEENGLITTRNKEVKIRPLNKTKIAEERAYWQVVNLVVPVVLLVLYGLVRAYLRKRKYTLH